MEVGAITGYVDLAQIILYAFWAFFAGIIFYLVRENHREGYPMESESPGGAVVTGWPIPEPKTYQLAGGKEVTIPDPNRSEPPINNRRDGTSYGNPYIPTGDPMTNATGPSSYAMRADVPDMDVHGHPIIRPLRALSDFGVSTHDTDPRGLSVIGGDGKVAGKVVDMWVDTCEMMFRYIEVETDAGGSTRKVLLPVPFARIQSDSVKVNSIFAAQFGSVPGIKNPEQITLLEEDQIAGYYGGGTLYAHPDRSEPVL
jgi:photosynthetic reaction center H subunit